MESTRRNLAPEMSRAGCSHTAIIAATGYQMATVRRTVAELKMAGNVQRWPEDVLLAAVT